MTRLPIKKYIVFLFPVLVIVFSIMYFSMFTAKDRDAYTVHFLNPFSNSRIEIGFSYYMYVFNGLGVPPNISIPFTCTFIYFLLYKFWFKYSPYNWFFSALAFNFIAFSVMNYYVGTSIRMGLAIAIGIFAVTKIIEGKKKFFALLLCSPLIQYGASLLVVISAWVFLFRRKGWRFHLIVIVFASLLAYFLSGAILNNIEFSNYYSQYVNDGLGKTERFFPFTVLFYMSSLILIFFYGLKKSFKGLSNELFQLFLVFLYSVPVLFSWFATKVSFLPKMMMPSIFFGAFFVFFFYQGYAIKSIGKDVCFFVFLILNFLAMVYAFNMYGLI